MNDVTITIPAVIDAAITPNNIPVSRGGMMKKHRLQQEIKATTMWAVKGADIDVYPFPPWVLHYVIAWPKGRKMLDDDNAKASLKYVQDGIAEEIGVDDRYIRVGTVTQVRSGDRSGYIKVAIESEATDATN